MHNHCRTMPWLLGSIALPVLLVASLAPAQTRPAAPASPAQTANATVPTEKDLAVTQSQMLKLLRLSPTLTTVVEHDPSLLANQDYVSRNNPQLAQFLAAHPEIARNPEFYLFTHMDQADGSPDEALERAVWPELASARPNPSMFQGFLRQMPPVLALACFLVALVWTIRVIIENRRWGRIFKLQSEVHGRLIDKFSSNQELALYMETEAGRRFLEAAPIPVSFEPQQRVPNAVARVLTPLQIGIVLTLLGTGLLFLRGVRPEMDIPMLVVGTVVLMPGLGFIISAGITWVMAARLGLMPENPAAPNKVDPPSESKDQQ
jgi:hypothetical protein